MLGYPKEEIAIYNSYSFSLGYLFLWLKPLLLSPASTAWAERIQRATSHWIVWMSCFTQLAFQIPHNLAVPFLFKHAGEPVEWPVSLHEGSLHAGVAPHGGRGFFLY